MKQDSRKLKLEIVRRFASPLGVEKIEVAFSKGILQTAHIFSILDEGRTDFLNQLKWAFWKAYREAERDFWFQEFGNDWRSHYFNEMWTENVTEKEIEAWEDFQLLAKKEGVL